MEGTRRTPVAITIAGSDSGGGAGIQADLKAFAACGVHGTSAIVVLTAQNTLGVTSIHTVPPEMVIDQVRAVTSDIGVDAVKIGMLGDEATIAAVEEALALTGDAPVVVDPVMVAESGAVLLEPGAVRALTERILPLATVATPNLPEARELTGLGPDATAEDLARAVQALGPDVAVVTGGHGDGRGGRLLRRAGLRGDRGAAPRRRRRPRLGVHALVGPRRAPGARRRASRGCPRRAADRRRGGRERASRRRRGSRPRGRARDRRPGTERAEGIIDACPRT